MRDPILAIPLRWQHFLVDRVDEPSNRTLADLLEIAGQVVPLEELGTSLPSDNSSMKNLCYFSKSLNSSRVWLVINLQTESGEVRCVSLSATPNMSRQLIVRRGLPWQRSDSPRMGASQSKSR